MLNALEKAAVRHLVAKHFKDSGMDDKDWCKLQGVSTKWLSRRKNDPEHKEFQSAVESQIASMEDSVDITALVMRDWALEELYVQYQASEGSEKRQWLKLILENTSHVDTGGSEVDYSDLSESDLIDIILLRNLTPQAMSQRELARLKG